MTKPWRETACSFECGNDTLVGVLSEPASAHAGEVGVVIIVGGPQYRAGSHRMFVQLARGLAARGMPALRFDVRGMGDSSGEPRGFEQQSEDTDAALAELRRLRPSLRCVVLWGLCDGASSALMYLEQRPEKTLGGVCIVNPWVRTQALQARTNLRHYYLQRLVQPAFWRKLIGGGVGLGALRDLRDNVQRAGDAGADNTRPYVQRMLEGLQRHQGPVLLVQSGNDYTAREFDELLSVDARWRRALSESRVKRTDVPGADHTFSVDGAMERLITSTVEWLQDEVALQAA